MRTAPRTREVVATHRAHGPVSTVSACSLQRVAHDRVGDAVPGLLAPGSGREDRGHHAPGAVDRRPAGVARPHLGSHRDDRSLHRAAPVRILRDDRGRAAEPCRRHCVRAVLREAEDGTRRALLGVRVHSQRRHAGEARHAQDRKVVVGVEPDGVRIEPGTLSADLHGRVVLPRHHVSVRHHDPPARHPATSLHAQAAGRAEHANHAAAGRRHIGVTCDLRIGRPDIRRGPGDGRERVEARERLEDRARGREHLVQLLEDRRALDRLPEITRAGCLQRHRPADPHEEQSEAGHEQPTPDAVEQPDALTQAATQVEPEQLKARGEQSADQHRSQQRGQRRVRRVRAVLEEQRSEPRADERARREPDERQSACDQSLAVAPHGHQDGERDDDPVKRRQRGLRLLAVGTIGRTSQARSPLP